jgi:hypothetical protein
MSGITIPAGMAGGRGLAGADTGVAAGAIVGDGPAAGIPAGMLSVAATIGELKVSGAAGIAGVKAGTGWAVWIAGVDAGAAVVGDPDPGSAQDTRTTAATLIIPGPTMARMARLLCVRRLKFMPRL